MKEMMGHHTFGVPAYENLCPVWKKNAVAALTCETEITWMQLESLQNTSECSINIKHES